MTLGEETQLDAAVLETVVEGCPDAFVALDRGGTVLVWNAAATRLLGWRAEDVLGRPAPHLDVYEPTIPDSGSATAVRRHRDGRRLLLSRERVVTLTGSEGAPIGWGEFLRPPPTGDHRLARRNDLSLALAEALRIDEVNAALQTAVGPLLGADRALLLRHQGDSVAGYLAVGAAQKDAEEVRVDVDLPSGPPGDWGPLVGHLAVGREPARPTVFLPAGPREEGWILALAFADETLTEEADLELATALASETWLAVKRADLILELEGRVEILEATAAISLAAGLDLERLLEAVCASAAEALSCERAAIYLREPDGHGRLRLAHLHGGSLAGFGSDGSRGAAWLLDEGTQITVQPGEDLPHLDGPWSPDEGVVALLAQPLRVGDLQLGVLLAAHTVARPRGFTPLCRKVAEAVGRQASPAIANARLFAGERQAVRHLSELEQLKEDYISGIIHDLKSPLTGLLGFVSTLRRLDVLSTPEERREYLDIMDRQARRLAGLVEDLLVGARMEAGRLQPDETSEVALGELVRDVLASLAPDRRVRAQLTVDGDDRVCADRLQLERLVQNLVDNALHHSAEPSAVEVAVQRDGDEVVLAVRDHGAGIPAGSQAELFTRFARGTRRRGSTGLGLWIVRGIVEAHGGTVGVQSQPGKGATFAARLPAMSEQH
ncbi:MAG: PAS domain-containing protein [Euzebyales bacterium]|nr:PAS domain-containing protein [Euzebyales bacterium]